MSIELSQSEAESILKADVTRRAAANAYAKKYRDAKRAQVVSARASVGLPAEIPKGRPAHRFSVQEEGDAQTVTASELAARFPDSVALIRANIRFQAALHPANPEKWVWQAGETQVTLLP